MKVLKAFNWSCMSTWSMTMLYFFISTLNDFFLIDPFKGSVSFHTETTEFDFQCKSNDWFLYGMQHEAEMDQKMPISEFFFLMSLNYF